MFAIGKADAGSPSGGTKPNGWPAVDREGAGMGSSSNVSHPGSNPH